MVLSSFDSLENSNLHSRLNSHDACSHSPTLAAPSNSQSSSGYGSNESARGHVSGFSASSAFGESGSGSGDDSSEGLNGSNDGSNSPPTGSNGSDGSSACAGSEQVERQDDSPHSSHGAVADEDDTSEETSEDTSSSNKSTPEHAFEPGV